MAGVNGFPQQYPWNAQGAANNFIGQQRGYQPMDPPMMNLSSQPGLSIATITSDDQVANYPVASGNTVAFINFTTNRLCFKTTNVNGVPMPLQWATFTYDQPQTSQQNLQNLEPFATKGELDEIRGMLKQLLSQDNQSNHDSGQRQPRKERN